LNVERIDVDQAARCRAFPCPVTSIVSVWRAAARVVAVVDGRLDFRWGIGINGGLKRPSR